MAGGLHRRPRFDLIGHVPKRRAGGPPLKHKAIMLGIKPAQMFDAQHNHPINAQQMARKSGIKVAEAVAHVGGLMLLGKSLDGHDAFEVSKGLTRAAHAGLVRVKHAGHVGVASGRGGKAMVETVAPNKRAEYAAMRLRRHWAGKNQQIQIGQDARRMGDVIAVHIRPKGPAGGALAPTAKRPTPVGMRGPAQGRLVPVKPSGRSAAPRTRGGNQNATVLVSQDSRRAANTRAPSGTPTRARV